MDLTRGVEIDIDSDITVINIDLRGLMEKRIILNIYFTHNHAMRSLESFYMENKLRVKINHNHAETRDSKIYFIGCEKAGDENWHRGFKFDEINNPERILHRFNRHSLMSRLKSNNHSSFKLWEHKVSFRDLFLNVGCQSFHQCEVENLLIWYFYKTEQCRFLLWEIDNEVRNIYRFHCGNGITVYNDSGNIHISDNLMLDLFSDCSNYWFDEVESHRIVYSDQKYTDFL